MLAKRKTEWTAAELIDSLRGAHVAGADLKALVELTREFIDEDLERRVAVLKASRDGAPLPAETLRRELVRQRCRCEAALTWPHE
jgi:hypothetical protein